MTHPPVPLGTFPTPVEPAPRLATALGLGPEDLWVKRDDLTGLGGGGNKIRKLEWTVGAGASLAEAAGYAARVGAAAVTKPGAQESYPTAEEVRAL